MDFLSGNLAIVLYLIASVCFILALRHLTTPETATRGATLGSVGAVLAVLTVFLSADLDHLAFLLGALVVGGLAGFVLTRRPSVSVGAVTPLVALSGGVAALVALLELTVSPIRVSTPFDFLQPEDHALPVSAPAALLATSVAIFLGTLALAGGFAASRRLRSAGEPPAARRGLASAVCAVALGLGLLTVAQATLWSAIGLAVAGVVAGLLLVLPVAAEDVTVVMTLLVGVSGLSVAALGFVLGAAVLLIAGTLVGVGALVLARTAAHASERPLGDLFAMPRA